MCDLMGVSQLGDLLLLKTALELGRLLWHTAPLKKKKEVAYLSHIR